MILRFRAWDKRKNVMRDVAVLHFTKNGKIDSIEYWINPTELKAYHVRNIELMQSTGLEDKNGVEIFEGDIALITHKSTNYADTYWHSYVEVFRAKNGAYRIRGEHIYETELYSNRKQLTVAGNIYNSPELLKRDRFMTTTENPELLEVE